MDTALCLIGFLGARRIPYFAACRNICEGLVLDPELMYVAAANLNGVPVRCYAENIGVSNVVL